MKQFYKLELPSTILFDNTEDLMEAVKVFLKASTSSYKYISSENSRTWKTEYVNFHKKANVTFSMEQQEFMTPEEADMKEKELTLTPEEIEANKMLWVSEEV